MDGISTRVEVDGVAETLKVLNRVLPELKRQTVRNIRAAGQPAIEAVRQLIPTASPLSGWAQYNWTTPRGYNIGSYNAAKARAGVKVQFRGSKVRGAADPNTIPLLRLRQTDAAGAAYDMAGRISSGKGPNGRQFIQVLTSRDGHPSRTMWPGAERAMPVVTRQVEAAVDDMMKTINKEFS